MFPVFNNFSQTPCMKVGLDVRIYLIRVLSTGGGGNLPPNCFIKKKKKVFPETNYFKC